MHVALLTVDFSVRGSGGIGAYVHTLASGLTARGHDATVVTSRGGRRSDGSYAVVEVSGEDVLREARRPQLSVAFRDAVLALHDRRRIDVVEATDYGLEGLACVVDQTIAASGIATVVRMHTPDSIVCELNGEIRYADSPAVHACEAEYIQAARHISAPSLAMARQVERRWGVGGDRVTVLANPIDTTEMSAAPRAPRSDGRYCLCYFGRLERRKGVYVLGEALAEVLPLHPGLDVVFVGADTRTVGGSVGRSLRERLSAWSDRVKFVGFLEGDDRLQVLLSADAVCLPSLWENFPYTCLEALACGRPVIATGGSGFDEIIRDNVDGFLVPAGDARALAIAIDEMVRGGFSPSADALSERVAAYDAERLLPHFERYYERLVA